jgi:hypothetical protein
MCICNVTGEQTDDAPYGAEFSLSQTVYKSLLNNDLCNYPQS